MSVSRHAANWFAFKSLLTGKVDTSKLDCSKCGACCIGQRIVIEASDDIPFAMFDGFEMRQQSGRCVALAGRINRDVSCTIYERRPRICRVMVKGSLPCLAIRANWGLR